LRMNRVLIRVIRVIVMNLTKQHLLLSMKADHNKSLTIMNM
jgi:hypothetical protein